LTFHAQTVPVN